VVTTGPYDAAMQITDAVREFLASGPFAHVVTRHPDGRLHVTLAWAGIDGDELVFSTFYDVHKMADLRRDPRVTLSFQAKENVANEMLHPYLVIDGQARVVEGGALAVMDALAPAYIGQDEFPNRTPPSGAVFRVTIERIYGMGAWRGRGRG
jgi:PPOX class probable F420-dependent enzyme